MNIFKVKGKYKLTPLLCLVVLPVVGAILVGYITRNSMVIYNSLIRPIFAPPAIIFPIVWTSLYILMGLASYRIYMHRDLGEDVGSALFFYLIQLLLNYLWPLLFFSFRLYGLAFIETLILGIFVVITFIKFLKIDKIAGFLLVPYLIWMLFAGVLNFFLWMFNEM